MEKIFVSYSRQDAASVDKIVAHLVSKGLELWTDRSNIQAGELWRSQIVEAISTARAFIILLSPHSIRSENVRKELDLAESENRRIFPVIISPVDIPATMRYQLSGVQMIDLSSNLEEGLARLTNALTIGTPQSTPAQNAVSASHVPKSRWKAILFGAAIALLVLILRLLVEITIDAISLRLGRIPSFDIPYSLNMILPYTLTGAICGAVYAHRRNGLGWLFIGVLVGILAIYLLLGGRFGGYDDAASFSLYLGIPAGALLGIALRAIGNLLTRRP